MPVDVCTGEIILPFIVAAGSAPAFCAAATLRFLLTVCCF